MSRNGVPSHGCVLGQGKESGCSANAAGLARGEEVWIPLVRRHRSAMAPRTTGTVGGPIVWIYLWLR